MEIDVVAVVGKILIELRVGGLPFDIGTQGFCIYFILYYYFFRFEHGKLSDEIFVDEGEERMLMHVNYTRI